MNYYPPEHVAEGDLPSDPCLTISQWIERLETLARRYGRAAVLQPDAGHNNIGWVVTPTRKQR